MPHDFSTEIRQGVGRWLFTCTCGWTGERTSLYNSKHEAPKVEWCSQHLRQAHGAHTGDLKVKRRRKNLTMSGIDMRLLDDEEKKAYQSVLHRALPLRAFTRLFISLALWACACVAAVVLLTSTDANGLAPVILLALLFVVIPSVVINNVGGRDVRRARRQLVQAYLTSIKYAQRTYRDDVKYLDGKAIRSIQVSGGGTYYYRDGRGRRRLAEQPPDYREVKVAYGDVPPADEDWPDDEKSGRR